MSLGLKARMALAKYGFHFTHSLGQNFILDDPWIERILDAAGVKDGQNVLEIGPGAGLMTAMMAQRGARVVAVELDTSLAPVLEEMLGEFPHATVVYEDILKCDIAALTAASFGGETFDVVANLPYYITADAILALLRTKLPMRSITVMVQKEAAERILSVPGEKKYSALAATVRYFAASSILMDVPPDAFTPKPHVDSVLLRIDRHAEKPVVVRDEERFLRLIQAAFAMRRKTLVNNLTAAFGLSREQALELLEAVRIPAQARGEALSLEELGRIADQMERD